MSAAEAAPASPPPRRREGLKELLLDGGRLAALSALALAQPLFDLLSGSPEFFAARGSPTLDIFVFAVGLIVVPPALLLALEALAGLVNPPLRRWLHLTFVALLAGLIAIQALKKPTGGLPPAVPIAVAAIAGAALAAAYARSRAVESFLTVLIPAPLVFLLLFLFLSPISKLTLASEASAASAAASTKTPVVMLLLDELPLTSLLDGKGEIDARRYPNFARFAREATWFRNATGVYDSTAEAIPAILDGRYPEKDKLPIAADHPASLFTLLGGSHRMHVSEEATRVCPRRLCRDERRQEPFRRRIGSMASDVGLVYAHVVAPKDLERELPSVSETWGDFGGTDVTGQAGPRRRSGPYARLGGAPHGLALGREAGFDRFVDAIRPTRRPVLHFLHALLPHVPWQYLPSGRHYRERRAEAIPGLVRDTLHDEGQVEQAYQRHLLQLGFTDLKLGLLLRRLERTRLYDRALVVVAADHGITLRRGQPDRRRVNRANFEDLAPVPLFMKEPGQRTGRVEDAYVETVDIVPTIADLLDVAIPWETDGRSAFSDEVRSRRSVRMLTRDEYEPIELTAAEFERRKRGALRRKLSLFGSGDAAGLFRIGPHAELLGRLVSPAPARGGGLRADIDARGRLRSVAPRSLFVPSHITGRVIGGRPGATRDVAVAVNGRVTAVQRSFYVKGSDVERISALVPESVLRPGANRVDVFEVSRASGELRLSRLGGA